MRFLLLTFVMTSCGASDVLVGKDCTSDENQSWDITSPDQPMAFKIEQCRVDADACKALCTLVMQEKEVSSESGATSCEVEFEGATTHVTAGFTVHNDIPGCEVPEF